LHCSSEIEKGFIAKVKKKKKKKCPWVKKKVDLPFFNCFPSSIAAVSNREKAREREKREERKIRNVSRLSYYFVYFRISTEEKSFA